VHSDHLDCEKPLQGVCWLNAVESSQRLIQFALRILGGNGLRYLRQKIEGNPVPKASDKPA
jgi:hypothetical protein